MGLLRKAEKILELRYLKQTGELMCQQFKEMDDRIHKEVIGSTRVVFLSSSWKEVDAEAEMLNRFMSEQLAKTHKEIKEHRRMGWTHQTSMVED